MSENKPSVSGEDSFDAFLSANLPEKVAPEISEKVTPWTDALLLILLSMGLGLITFQTAPLFTVIQGSVCYALGLLGWNRLRGENASFRRGWILMLVRTTWFVVVTILQSTIYSTELGALLSGDLQFILSLAFSLLLLVQIVCLRDGIAAVQKKSGAEEDIFAVGCLIGAYAVMFVMALIGAGGAFGLIVLIVSFAGLVGVGRLSHSLDEAGYTITPSSVRITPRALLGVYLGILILGSLIGLLFFSSRHMKWQAPAPDSHSETAAVREQLLSLGFPEAVLSDLSEDDILACSGAVSVMHNESTYHSDKLYGLHLESVAVVLSEKPRVWKVFYHFSLPDIESYHGTDALELQPFSLFRSLEISEKPHGFILTGEDDVRIAAIPYVKEGGYYQNINIFTPFINSGNGSGANTYFASFSLPNEYQNARGYVTLTVENPYPGVLVWDEEAKSRISANYNNGLYYTHQNSLQYPVLSAEASRYYSSGSWKNDHFTTVEMPWCWFFPGED